MIESELGELSGRICGWFRAQQDEGIPAASMCEAFIMIPLMQWLVKRNFKNLEAEFWDREINRQDVPYHAFDLKAERMSERYLFDMKYIKKRSSLNFGLLKKDLIFLGDTRRKADYRYCLVAGQEDCFRGDDHAIRIEIEKFSSIDHDNKMVLGCPIIGRAGGYLTLIFQVSGSGPV
jgi:hypothetical protein